MVVPVNPYKVLIEIPKGSANKYEFNEKNSEFTLDFVFRDGLKFPFNYGEIPGTKSEDGDRVDVAVFSTEPILRGTIVDVMPIAMLALKDRGEQDNKIIAVPVADPLYEKMRTLADFSPEQQSEFIEFYRQVGVQKNKTMEFQGFLDIDEAIAEIERCKI